MPKRRQKESSDQITFAFCAPVITPNGDGSFTVKPGKPVERLTPTQVGNHFGLNRDTIYRYRDEGIIPPEMVYPAGLRKLRFDAQVIPYLEDYFKRVRE